MESPDYGPAGKPSPGRVVRLTLLYKDVPIQGPSVPATIHTVDVETGIATLVFDDLPIFDPTPEHLHPPCGVVERRYLRHVPFGGDCLPRWDWWTKV